jgi:glycosyltransferase involved in cell wall biosynthesis
MTNILSISQYGAGLLSTQALSGAIDRQKDYAEALTKYVVLVPGKNEVVRHGDSLEIHGVPAPNMVVFSLRVYRRAVALHRELHFDGIMVDNPHVGGVLGMILKVRLSVPLVVHSMADVIYNPWYVRERFSNHIKHALMRVVVRCADVVRVSTKAEIARLTKKGVSSTKLHLMYFYIDAETFKQRLAVSNATRERGRILFVGRLSYQKDIGTLIRAMVPVHAKHPEAKLVLLGGGELQDELRMLAKSLNLDDVIEFTGSIPYEAVPREFKKASIFALASLYEGTCMVLHEAAAARLPIVSTDHAGAVDFVQNGIEGHCVPVRDYVALGSALIDLLDDDEKRVSCGEAAYQRLDAFTREQSLVSWRELIAKVVARKS